MTIDHAAQKYLEWKASYTTKAPYTYALHLKRLEQFLKNKDVEDITLSDIVCFTVHLKEGYSLANVAYSISIIKNFFSFLVRQGIKTVDPFFIKRPKFTNKQRVVVTRFDMEEMNRLLSEDTFYMLERKVIINLLWDTGMRLGELVAMDTSDIDTQKRMAVVETEKNKQLGWIMWSKETHAVLLKYLGIRICLNEQQPLFIASDHGGRRERIAPRTIQRWIKEIIIQAGIEKQISAHSFRHGKAHEILRQGGGAVQIARILRHSEKNPYASFLYVRFNAEEFSQIAEKYL